MSDPQSFQHDTLLYHGTEEFLAGTIPFIVEGVTAGEPVLVAVAADRSGALRGALGETAESVMFVDMRQLGSNPARIISAWQDFTSDLGGESKPVRGIGEPVWPERTKVELSECERHEALLNVAFDNFGPFRLLCPYDTSTLDADAIAAAHRTHPFVIEGGVRRASQSWTDVESMAVPEMDDSLSAPPPSALVMPFGPDDLRRVRAAISELGDRGGLPPALSADLALSAHELAVNSVRHGGGTGTLLGWHSRSQVSVEVRDQGVIADPLAGRQRPTAGQVGGRGLWLASQLCDLIQIRQAQNGGGVVRIHMNVPAPKRNGSVTARPDTGRSAGSTTGQTHTERQQA